MTEKLQELKQLGMKYAGKRRGSRMNSRVQIRLEWDVTEDRRQAAEAFTRVVNPYGCMVVLAESLELDQRVALTNLATETSNAAVIVWKGNQQQNSWEYGVELV